MRFASIRLHYLLAYAIVGSYMPYLPVFLGRDLGMPDWQIGWIAGMYGMAVIFSPPLVTYLADRRVSGRALIGLGYALTGLALLALSFARSFVPVLLISMAFSMVYTPMFALLDGLTFSAAAAEQLAGRPVPRYDRIRVWGSFGFMIPAFALFFILQAGAASGRAAMFAAAVAAALGLLCVPLLPRIAPTPAAPVPGDSLAAPVPGDSLSVLAPPVPGAILTAPVPGDSLSRAASLTAPVPGDSLSRAASLTAPVPGDSLTATASLTAPVPGDSLTATALTAPSPPAEPVPAPTLFVASGPMPAAGLISASPVPWDSLSVSGIRSAHNLPFPPADVTPADLTSWQVLSGRPTRSLLFPLGLLFAAIAVFYGFYARLVLTAGIDPAWVGLVMNIGVLSELPFMLAAGALLRRFSLRQLVLFGAACLTLRMLLLATIADPRVIIGSQVLHGPVVVAIYLIPPMYINLKAPAAVRNGVQGLYAMLCFGFARLLGSVVGGYAAGLGLAWAFGVGAVLAGFALLWLWLRFFDPAADAALRAPAFVP